MAKPLKQSAKTKLDTLGRVASELGCVYRDMRAGKVDATLGTKLAYVLNVLRQTIADADIEPRLREMEQRLEGRR